MLHYIGGAFRRALYNQSAVVNALIDGKQQLWSIIKTHAKGLLAVVISSGVGALLCILSLVLIATLLDRWGGGKNASLQGGKRHLVCGVLRVLSIAVVGVALYPTPINDPRFMAVWAFYANWRVNEGKERGSGGIDRLFSQLRNKNALFVKTQERIARLDDPKWYGQRLLKVNGKEMDKTVSVIDRILTAVSSDLQAFQNRPADDLVVQLANRTLAGLTPVISEATNQVQAIQNRPKRRVLSLDEKLEEARSKVSQAEGVLRRVELARFIIGLLLTFQLAVYGSILLVTLCTSNGSLQRLFKYFAVVNQTFMALILLYSAYALSVATTVDVACAAAHSDKLTIATLPQNKRIRGSDLGILARECDRKDNAVQVLYRQPFNVTADALVNPNDMSVVFAGRQVSLARDRYKRSIIDLVGQSTGELEASVNGAFDRYNVTLSYLAPDQLSQLTDTLRGIDPSFKVIKVVEDTLKDPENRSLLRRIQRELSRLTNDRALLRERLQIAIQRNALAAAEDVQELVRCRSLADDYLSVNKEICLKMLRWLDEEYSACYLWFLLSGLGIVILSLNRFLSPDTQKRPILRSAFA